MNPLIVCGTDFSPPAESALGWAATLARREGGAVDLVHVVSPVSVAGGGLVFDLATVSEEQIAHATALLQEVARAVAKEYGVSVRSHLLSGAPHEEILRHARQENARMIVLGTGTATLDRWMLGSVAERAARSADRPVVLVPQRANPGVWNTGVLAGERRLPRVVAGLGHDDDGSVVSFVAGLRQAAPCDVTFLRLYWPMEEYARLGLQGRRDLFKADPDVAKNLEPALRAKLNGVGGRGDLSLDIRPAWGDPAANLLVAVEDANADLLVVGAHQRHGVGPFVTGTIAQRLARQSRHVPTAVIPSGKPSTAEVAGIPILRTVLAVTDFSEMGNAAIPHAYALVRAAGGVVELCHVHEHALPSPAYAFDAPRPSLSPVDGARLLKDLQALVPPEARALGIATHVSIVDGGKAAKAIVQASERLDVDAIALASHGRSGLTRTLLGSVAQEVLHRARRPVYILRSS